MNGKKAKTLRKMATYFSRIQPTGHTELATDYSVGRRSSKRHAHPGGESFYTLDNLVLNPSTFRYHTKGFKKAYLKDLRK